MTWKTIDSAPTTAGTRIHCKRVVEGVVIHEGEAVWRTETIAGGLTTTGWMHPEKAHKVPVPTHWKPVKDVA